MLCYQFIAKSVGERILKMVSIWQSQSQNTVAPFSMDMVYTTFVCGNMVQQVRILHVCVI